MVLTKKILDAKSLQLTKLWCLASMVAAMVSMVFSQEGTMDHGWGQERGVQDGVNLGLVSWPKWWRCAFPRVKFVEAWGECVLSFQSHLQRAATRSQKMWTCDRNSDVHHGAYKPCVVAESYMCVYYGGTPMRHRKTACFEALVLEPHFAQSCARFLLLYCLLVWRTSLQRLKVAAHVLVKSWFAAPLPCTFQCFVRKVKNAHRR